MRLFTFITCLLALCVIVLGAYTRLTDAGLGCPDWPGCYGHWTVPADQPSIAQAELAFQQPLETGKAWTEMTHRYLAGSLGFCILLLSLISFWQYRQKQPLPLMPLCLLVLVIFQGLLGMWTVTLRLLPVIIWLHLLGGLAILSLLWWYFLTLNNTIKQPLLTTARTKWIILGIVLLVLQISLGGLTSANYAALICPDLPYCQGQWLPPIDLSVLLHINTITHDNTTLVTFHMLHRIGALIVAAYLFGLALMLLLQRNHLRLKLTGCSLILLLILQLTLGLLNVLWLLPLSIAVAHNAVAALLLLTLVTLLFLSSHTNAPKQLSRSTYE